MDDLKRKSIDEQVSGTGEKFKGKVKEGVGKVTGDEQLEDEGQVEQAEGTVREKAGQAGRAVSDAAERLREKVRGDE